VKRDDVQRGQVLAAPGSVKTYKEFEAELYVLTQEEGGFVVSCITSASFPPFFKSHLFPKFLFLNEGLLVSIANKITHFSSFSSFPLSSTGGRHTPFLDNYRPQFYIRTADVTGSITLGEGKEMAMPGDNIAVKVRKKKKKEREEATDFVRLGASTHFPPSLPPSLPSSPRCRSSTPPC